MRAVVGMKVRMIPVTFCDYDPKENKLIVRPIPGEIIYVHPKGRYFCVEFTTLGGKIKECFCGGAIK